MAQQYQALNNDELIKVFLSTHATKRRLQNLPGDWGDLINILNGRLNILTNVLNQREGMYAQAQALLAEELGPQQQNGGRRKQRRRKRRRSTKRRTSKRRSLRQKSQRKRSSKRRH
tara:strand:- start:808 stop:1155 length:348 start_codon:yes stop_codon:yes gene_type:complete